MWAEDVNIYPTKEDRQVGNKHLKRYCTSYITREMQILKKKAAMRCYSTTIRMVKI